MPTGVIVNQGVAAAGRWLEDIMTGSMIIGAPALTAGPILAGEQCDRCPAQAQVRWIKGDAVIDTCAHHGRRFEAALYAWASVQIDNRDCDGRFMVT